VGKGGKARTPRGMEMSDWASRIAETEGSNTFS